MEGVIGADTDPAASRAGEPWSRAKRRAFDVLGPAAVCLVATDGPVSVTLYDSAGAVVRALGHNRAVWPAKVARTGAWKDTTTEKYDQSALARQTVRIRLWAPSAAARDAVAARVVEIIDRRADDDGGVPQLINGFQDLGPQLDFSMFKQEIVDIAARIGVRLRDDDALSRYLDRVVAVAEARSHSGEVTRGVLEWVTAFVDTW